MPRSNQAERRAESNLFNLRKSREDRDIAGDYPKADTVRRDLRDPCERDLRRFCSTYFPNAFDLPWSEDHLRAIAKMEAIILDGGLFALAMPRASGKTAISIRAAIWALAFGHRRFVCLIAATEELARRLLKAIKTELTFNEALVRDFRAVCYPLVRLENNARKCVGQLFDGEQTRIDWSDDRLTFPTLPDSACDGVNVSGSTVTVAGLTGAIRGQSHTLASGEVVRPEVVILDDPQTRESASSVQQSAYRASVVQGDVLGMAGPGKDIAAIMPCTVIRADDMAARMLDRRQNPEWGGQKTKMVYSFPTNGKLWEEYRAIRDEDFQADRGPDRCNAFYAERRELMDAGAVVAWPARFGRGELSALQHAMNLRFRNEPAFFAEYQNDPLPDDDPNVDDLTPDVVCARVNRRRRGVVPDGCHRLTAFVDVQASLLYYVVCGWEDDFTGAVVDYGTYPDQKRPYFSLRDATNTLARSIKAAGLEGRIYAGLGKVADLILGRDWTREDGTVLKIERCLIDANWSDSTRAVHKFCRESPHAAVLVPSHGVGITAGGRPMSEWAKKPGEKAGFNWRLGASSEIKSLRRVMFDANFWKSFVHARLSTAMGDRGALTLFGDKAEAHRLFADHVCAEHRERTEGRGRTVYQWSHPPGRGDNHWWDGLVGCAVAASMLGVVLAESAAPKPAGAVKPRASFSEMQRAARAKREGARL